MTRHIRRAMLALALLSWGSRQAVAQTPTPSVSITKYWEACPDFLTEQKELVLEVLKMPEQERKLPYDIYGGLSLLRYSDRELSLRTSSLSVWTLRILPLSNGGHILALITTVEEPSRDSQIHFYTPGWSPLRSSDYFAPPSPRDFFTKGQIKPELERLLSPLYCTYSFTAEGNLDLQLSPVTILDDTLRDTLSEELAQMPHLLYEWSKDRYRSKQ